MILRGNNEKRIKTAHRSHTVLIDVLKHALMITSFVLIMMLLIEYINVQTRGRWQLSLRRSRFGQ